MCVDAYKTVSTSVEVDYKEKSSRFIGQIFPVKNESECKRILQDLRSAHPSANHVCYAFRLGVTDIFQRSSDAGEPSGTAGEPILRQLVKHELTYVLLTVVRYFGGKKLGVQGLISAYKSTSALVINKSAIKNEYLYLTMTLKFPYKYIDVVMRILDAYKTKIQSRTFEQDCEISFSIRAGHNTAFKNDMKQYHEIKIEEDN